MSTVKYNSQSERISVAELSREDDLMERNFKCVSAERLWSFLSGPMFKGLIFYPFSFTPILKSLNNQLRCLFICFGYCHWRNGGAFGTKRSNKTQ